MAEKLAKYGGKGECWPFSVSALLSSEFFSARLSISFLPSHPFLFCQAKYFCLGAPPQEYLCMAAHVGHGRWLSCGVKWQPPIDNSCVGKRSLRGQPCRSKRKLGGQSLQVKKELQRLTSWRRERSLRGWPPRSKRRLGGQPLEAKKEAKRLTS